MITLLSENYGGSGEMANEYFNLMELPTLKTSHNHTTIGGFSDAYFMYILGLALSLWKIRHIFTV